MAFVLPVSFVIRRSSPGTQFQRLTPCHGKDRVDREGEFHAIDSNSNSQVEQVVSSTALPQRIWTVRLCSFWSLARARMKVATERKENIMSTPCPESSCFTGSRTPIRNIIVNAEACTADDGFSVFFSTRARLLGIAYRILKSAADAEDLVQDVWIRWQTTERSTIRDAAAFLTTMTTRLAINVLRSARSCRERPFGSLLQESVDTCPDPRVEAERGEELRGAALVLLEKLSPAERAAYVLREAFDYSYREVSNILRLEEANARQLVGRARQHIADGEQSPVNSAEQRRFHAAFLAAAQKGALAKFESFLVGSADGRVRKGRRPLRTSSTLAEPIAVPRLHRWPLLPELAAEVCVNAPCGVRS